MALVSRGASTEGGVITRAWAPGVIAVEFERSRLSRLAVGRSVTELVEERAPLIIGRSSAESSLRSELPVFGELERLNASLVLFSMPGFNDRRVVFSPVVDVSLGVAGFEKNPDGILKALVKLIFLVSMLRGNGCVQEK